MNEVCIMSHYTLYRTTVAKMSDKCKINKRNKGIQRGTTGNKVLDLLL